jgi:chloramphenicol 3-O-phosphotransferase
VEPTPSMPSEAMRQILLRYRVAMSVADTYVRSGFTAVVQDIIVGPVLADVVEMSRTRPLHLIVLDPDTDAVAEREAHRGKRGYDQHWTPHDLVEALRHSTPRLGLWLDTTHQSPADTVRTILDRLPESMIDATTPRDARAP